MSSQRAYTVLIMGPPGAGKGTQAAHLVAVYGLRHIAIGDVLRDAVKAGTELGKTAKSFMDEGMLVTDDLIIAMLDELIGSLAAETGLLIDGFPRNVAQAEALTAMLAAHKRDIDAVIDIRVPTDELIGRLSGRWICRSCQTPYNTATKPPRVAGVCDLCSGELYQRADDVPEAIKTRLEVYAGQTAPVSAYYETRGLLRQVNGNQSPEAVQADLNVIMGKA